jgi:hypothetical protein
MRAQGRRAASGPVWADWFLELEEMLQRRETIRGRDQQSSSRHSRRPLHGKAGR